MMLYASLNGYPITRARIVIPYSGIWHADVWLDRVNDVTGSQSLQVDTLSLTGAVVRQVDFTGESQVRIVGGSGGWRKQVTPQFYKDANVSTILGDVASGVGERVNITSDSEVSPFYVVSSEDQAGNPMPASSVLQDLLGDAWYMDSTGVIQQGPRPSPSISSPFTIASTDGPPGVYQVYSEVIADWMPGATFSGPTVPTAQTISRVTHVLEAGKLHTEVMIPGVEDTDRMRASFEAMLRQYLPDLIYFATWDYTVVSVTDDPTPLIDANPGDPRLPKVAGLPLRPGPDGGTAIPPIGSQILIGFTRGQRQFPEVRALDPANPPTTVYLGGQAGPGVARLGDVVLAYMPSPCPISGTVTIAGTPSPLVGVIQIPGPLVGAIQVASVIVSAP